MFSKFIGLFGKSLNCGNQDGNRKSVTSIFCGLLSSTNAAIENGSATKTPGALAFGANMPQNVFFGRCNATVATMELILQSTPCRHRWGLRAKFGRNRSTPSGSKIGVRQTDRQARWRKCVVVDCGSMKRTGCARTVFYRLRLIT